MADEAAPSPKKKKLPFKRTALRRAPKPTPKDDSKEGDDDDLDLFRRAKEMAPIVAADRERRMRRKQKHEEQRRRSITAEKRPHELLEDEAPMRNSVSREASHLEEQRPAADESMTVVGDSFGYEVPSSVARTVINSCIVNSLLRLPRSDQGWAQYHRRDRARALNHQNLPSRPRRQHVV